MPLEERLQHAANYFGLELRRRKTGTGYGRAYGFRLEVNGTTARIKQVMDGSPAAKEGLHPGDEIVAVNGLRANSGNLSQLFRYFKNEPEVRLHIFRYEKLEEMVLRKDEYEMEAYMLTATAQPSEAQLRNLIAWLRIDGYKDPLA